MKRIRRDLNRRVSSAGYQQLTGNFDIEGSLQAAEITDLQAQVGVLSALSQAPAKMAPLIADAGQRSVTLRWNKQYTLQNLSHYELQVSGDQVMWFSLDSGGQRWWGELHADTEVTGETYQHANIPLDGKDVEGLVLYYRIRAVTLSGDEGDWSDPVRVRIYAQEIVLIDSQNRHIEISTRKGLYADDRAGNVLHDMPMAPIVAQLSYSGHLYWMKETNLVSFVDENILTDLAVYELYLVINDEITSYLEGNLNARGVYGFWYFDQYSLPPKNTANTFQTNAILAGLTYNCEDIGLIYPVLSGETYGIGSAFPGAMHLTAIGPAFAPIVKMNDRYYVSYQVWGDWYNMAAVSGYLHYTIYWSVMGLLI